MDLEELYEKFQARSGTVLDRTKARFSRAGYAYYSVLSGENVVIAASTHEYGKFKGFLLYVAGFVPITLNRYYIRRVVEVTGSNRRAVVMPLVGITHVFASAAGVGTMLGCIHLWKIVRSMYFASYLATLAFVIDDPHHKIYKESKIMRNTLS
jgi:hypothetical protein